MAKMNFMEFVPQGFSGEDYSEIFGRALVECAGGTLVVPAGTYRTGSLSLPSHTHLVLEKGAVIRFLDDFSVYEPVLTRWEGIDCHAMHPLLWINDSHDVTIEGQGTLDGSGAAWWKYIFERRAVQTEPELDVEKRFAALNPGFESQPGGGGGRQTQFLRPPLLQVQNSREVSLRGVRLRNSPFWTCHILRSSRVSLEDVSIANPYDSPNTDGIDIESSVSVSVRRCVVDVGDDGIAIKSGSDVSSVAASEHILVEDCTVLHAHGGVVIGSETAGGVHDVLVKNCRFSGTDRGVRIKTRRGRGGDISRIEVDGVTMDHVICPFTVNMYYRWGDDDAASYSLYPQPVTARTPSVSSVRYRNITATHCRVAGFFAGLPEMPIRDVTFQNVAIECLPDDGKRYEVEMFRGIPESPYRGIRLINADVRFENTDVNIDPPSQMEAY
jgi:polygalacturonase